MRADCARARGARLVPRPAWRLAGLAVATLLAGCAPAPPRPPILLVTVHGLRADAVGALGGRPRLTPHLDALAAAASFRGRAVAASTASGPALAALFTGLRPWQSQVFYDGVRLSPRFDTLPGVLAAAGYATAGFSEQPALRRGGGFVRGFEILQAQTARARGEVERRLCGDRPGFVWAHFDLVGAGYHRHDAFLDRVPDAPADLPERISRGEIERGADPRTPWSEAQRARAWALYGSGVAEADAQLGTLLEALRGCGHFDDAVIAVAGDHGEALGEEGVAGHGRGADRATLEVPLVIKLPRRARALPSPADRVSTTRLYATLVEAAGLPVAPAVGASLTVADPGGAESETFRLNGENVISLVVGDLQLVRRVRFAPADPDYDAARVALAEPGARAALSRPPRAIFNQLARAFRQTPPFRDRGDLRSELRRWTAAGGVEPLQDDVQTARLDALLTAATLRFVAEELTPAQARRR